MTKNVSTYLVIAGLLFSVTSLAQQAPVSLENTISFTHKSKIIGESYEIQIALPPGYARSQTRYKTLYVLDANVTFAMVRDIQTLISFEEANPPVIVVGVGYKGLGAWFQKRARDYMPTAVAAAPGSGGAARFLGFLEQELIPKIEEEFRTTEERIIYGHSTAALFGFYSLFKSLALFRGYILTSPSVDEDEQYTLDFLHQWKPENPQEKVSIYTSIGSSEQTSFQEAYEQLIDLMNQKKSPQLAYKTDKLRGTHMSSMPQAFVSGLQFVNGVK